MVFYIILRGPAGSGKTTIAERLASAYDGRHINIDRVKKGMGLKNTEEEKLRVNGAVVQEAMGYLRKGKVVIFDEVFYYESQLRQLEEMPFECYVFTLNSPLEVCLERNRQRRDAKDRGMSDDDVILVHSLVSKLKMGIEINTHDKPVDKTIDEIMSYLPKPE